MHCPGRRLAAMMCLVLATTLATSPAGAQVEDQLSSYTGANAEGYLLPLAEAFGATLNSGFYRSAYLPTAGFHIGFEVLVMGLYFSDSQGTFDATTEGAFIPQQTVTAPTIVGPGEAVVISTGQGGTSYAFPGGLNLNSFAMLAPQLRISSFLGTEFVGRYAKVKSGDAELGDVTLWGLGGRHNISQYLGETFPFDLAVGLIYQNFSAGENAQGNNLIASNAISVGVHGSKRLPAGFLTFEPYTALSYDSFGMTVDYENETEGQLKVDFDRMNNVHWTLGLNLNLIFTNLFAEYNVAGTNSFAAGIALGALGY
jgi:hypothetical protein